MHKIAMLLVGCFVFAAHAADPATVNGKPIKQSEVDFIIKNATTQGKKISETEKANIVEELITTELLEEEAQKSGITKDPDFVIKSELTLRELRVNTFIESYLKKNPIDDDALRAEYDRRKVLNSSQEYKAAHILVKTEDEAKALISKLNKGATFAQLAKEQSLDISKDNGGDLGWFPAESMVKPFGDAVVQLQKGSITATPVQTEFGWHVIRLEDTRALAPPPFDAVKNELMKEMQRQKLQQLISDLRAKAKIVKN